MNTLSQSFRVNLRVPYVYFTDLLLIRSSHAFLVSNPLCLGISLSDYISCFAIPFNAYKYKKARELSRHVLFSSPLPYPIHSFMCIYLCRL
jgi:hypothetical protein